MSNLYNSSDAIIIGGGIAGIVSALELLKLDKKVVLFERGKEENLGGLAKVSFGGMFFVDTPIQRRSGIKDSAELAYSDWCRVANFNKDDHYPKLWAKHYVYHCKNYVFEWLKEEGVKFFPVVHWVERGLFRPGNSYPRFHLVWGTGHELIRVLLSNLLQHPKAKTHLTLKCEHKVEEFIVHNKRIVGVKGVDENKQETFTAEANAVVIASGGIGGSIKRVKENWYKPWGDPPETILNGSHPYADGLLHDKAQEQNAKITHMDKMWPYAAGVHHPRPSIADEGLSLVPPKSALWMNYKGERIGPMPLITAYDTRFLVEQVCKQEKKYSWQVLNRKIADKEFAISGAEFNQAIRDKKLLSFLKTLLFGNKELVDDMINNCKDFVVANTIEELADKMNELTGDNDVDVEALKEAVSSYDDNIARGSKFFNDEQLRRIAHTRRYSGDKVRTSKFQQINDPKAGPLIAIREFIVSRKTLGGIQTDLQCKVMDNDGEIIPGLFSTGESAGFGGGGMHGQGALEGTFLGGCVFTARIVAHTIADKPLIE